jgi:hypothetical protein
LPAPLVFYKVTIPGLNIGEFLVLIGDIAKCVCDIAAYSSYYHEGGSHRRVRTSIELFGDIIVGCMGI